MKDSTISAAPSHCVPPTLTKQCACRANCGSTACERAKKASTKAKNQWGVFLVDQRWAWPLRMVAIYGWMLSQIRPSDFEAFLSYAPRIVGQGGCLNRRALLHLCADAFLQCPKAIHTWASMVADDGLPGVSAGNPESTATGYARMSVKVVNQCDLAINCNKASCEQMQA